MTKIGTEIPKVIFFHVMKTGGMTFRGILESIYGGSFHVCEDTSLESAIRSLAAFDCVEFHTLPHRGDFHHMHAELAARNRWDLLQGNHIFTMFREPVDQAVSQYFYLLEKRAFIEPTYRVHGVPFPESMEEFIESPWYFNNQLAFLAGKYTFFSPERVGEQDLAKVKSVLQDLEVHVGLTERYSDSLHVFETVTGKRIPGGKVNNTNRNPNRLALNEVPRELREKIRRQSALDIELYNFARGLFEGDIARCGSGGVYSYRDDASPNSPSSLRELEPRGYAIEPFLSPGDIQALTELHRQTTPLVPSDFYVSAFGGDPAVRRAIFQGIANIVEDKVRKLAPGYRILMASFATKRARGTQGRLPLHQDFSLVDPDKHLGLNIWIPLCDVDNRNGCLRVVGGSQAFGHISPNPYNPEPYRNVRGELNSGDYVVDLPMAAGHAFLFDSRVLHGTDENETDSDRTSVIMSLVPENAAARIYQWNRQLPDKLEVYEIDSEFLLRMQPNTYVENPDRLGAKFVGLIDYTFEPLTSADLALKLNVRQPAAEPPALPREASDTASPVRDPIPPSGRPAQIPVTLLDKKPGFFSRLLGRS